MGWKWENNAHSECKIQKSVTAGNTATPRPSCDSQPKFLDSTNTDIVTGICYHEDFRLCVKWADLWRERRKGRKRGCDGSGAVEGVEVKAGRSVSLLSFTVVPSVQLRVLFYWYEGGYGVTYLAIASSHFCIMFTCNSPNENRSCEESN